MLKRIVSILLAAVLVLTLSMTAFAENSESDETYTVYFYIPDGRTLSAQYEDVTSPAFFKDQAPYVYWFCYDRESHSEWPGVLMQKTDDDCVYQAEVPADAGFLIFNDNGYDAENHQYRADSFRTRDIYIQKEDMEEYYNHYPDVPISYDSVDGMIYVVTDVYLSETLGNSFYFGDWYYYYGDGCYGVTDIAATGERKEACCLNPAHTHDVFILGDADRDTTVSVMDATCIQKYKASLIGEDRIDLNAADVDTDGVVTVLDATKIQKQLAGL
ncbi:MAG: dockerin type I repeat-containing protein [Ruminococcus sp.]|nr:dockerin type I repeat-containing protein [Ruminococcus sp.]